MLILSSDPEYLKITENTHIHSWFAYGGAMSYSFAESSGTSCLTVKAVTLPSDGSPLSIETVENIPATLASYKSYTVEQCL